MLLLYIWENISLREGVLVLKEVKHYFRTTTPSQSEIFCEKLLLLLVLCIGLSGPAHPAKVKYSLKSCYCCLFYVLAFQDQHTLQSEIFCLKALIVDLREYFTLGGSAGPERPIATITALRQNISLWEGVLVLKGQYIEQATITAFQRIFHFGRVCWSWKANT